MYILFIHDALHFRLIYVFLLYRRSSIRIIVELQLTTNPVHKRVSNRIALNFFKQINSIVT